MEGGIPSGKPRVLPFVWHGEDVARVQVFPVAVASLYATRRRRRKGRISLEPRGDLIVVKLLCPQQSRVSLPLD